MDVKFKDKRTAKRCCDLSYAKKELGATVAERLMSHMNFIKNAERFEDIMSHLPFRFHKLQAEFKDLYALDVGRKLGYRIIIEPLDENNNSLKKEKDINIIKECTKIILVVEVNNHYE